MSAATTPKAVNSLHRFLRWGSAAVLLAVFRWMAPQWTWVPLIGVFWILTLAFVKRTHTDRPLIAIVMSSYALHVVGALALFAISLWHVPVLTELQSGNGFWRFSGDATYYHEGAQQLVHSWLTGIPVNRFFWERRFIVWVALIYLVLGPYPLNGILVNAWVGSLMPLLGLRLLRCFTRDTRAHRLTAFLLAFWPSLFLWSTQILKDPWLIAGLLIVLQLLCQLGLLSASEELVRARRRALKPFVVLCLLLLWMAVLRAYAIAILYGSFLVATVLWLGRTLWIERRAVSWKPWQMLACLGVLTMVTSAVVSVSTLDLVGMVTREPSPRAWIAFGATASNTTNACLVELERWVIRAPEYAASQGPQLLVPHVIDYVQSELGWDDATVRAVDRAMLEQAAATMLRERTAYVEASTTHQLMTQLNTMGSTVVPDAVQPHGWVLFSRLNEKRRGYATSGGVLVVDEHVRIDTLPRFIRYLPHAITNALLGPLPLQWGLSGVRSFYVLELLVLYPLYLILIPALLKLLRQGSFIGWFVGSYILLMALLLGMVIANLGILFRLRLMFLVPWLALVPLGLGDLKTIRAWLTRGLRLARQPALLSMVLLVGLGVGIAWWPVTTRQGINGVVSTRRIPLWVKATDFLIRDCRYRQIAHGISAGATDAQEKVIAIFYWTRGHLRQQPPELPVVDDHVYSVIERGYGIADQFDDVFTTLCAYAGVPATMVKLSSARGGKLYLALVKLTGRWCPLDPYRGVYFQYQEGRLVSVDELASEPGLLQVTRRGPATPHLEYGEFIHPGMQLNVVSLRPQQQMLWTRLWREITQRLTPSSAGRLQMAAQ